MEQRLSSSLLTGAITLTRLVNSCGQPGAQATKTHAIQEGRVERAGETARQAENRPGGQSSDHPIGRCDLQLPVVDSKQISKAERRHK